MLRLALALPFAAALFAQTPCAPTTLYGRCEIQFELNSQELSAHPNPYLTVQLHAEFRSPKFRTFLMPAYWDGGNRFVIRFAPVDEGEWTYRITSNIARFNDQAGTFVTTPWDAPGFIRPRNVHHWSYADSDRPHLWIGDTSYNFASMDKAEFTRMVDARAAQKFTHIRGVVQGRLADSKLAWPNSDKPGPDFFRNVDERVAYINSKGMVADLILGWGDNQLAKLFPTWQQRERFLRYMVARYSAFNVTWQLVQEFETYEPSRELMKELGLALKKLDPYGHPRTTHAIATSAPLLQDGWMDYVLYQSSDDNLGAIEHQLYPVPFVNAGAGCEDSGAGRSHPQDVDTAGFRRRLWNSTMNGQYPTYCNTGTYGGLKIAQDMKHLESPGAKQMTAWFDLFNSTRHWELEPYFDLDGGRAVALPGVEYIVYIEKPSGPVEVRVEKHGYEIRWIDPATGEVVPHDDMKSERIALDPPNRDHDWVLHIQREGHKEGMLKSYKFESQRNLMQEVEVDAKRVPFEVVQPSADEFSVSAAPPYEVKLTRQTRGTRSMMYLWQAEVSIDSQGYRIVGTGEKGTLQIPRNISRRYPGTVNIRLYGMNANGKVYSLDRVYRINQ